jgi:hypothetical protein
VSNALYRLVLIRWLWLLVVWTEFLRRVVRLPLRFSLCHPGKAGSLGCLGHTQVFFGIITFALSAAVAGGFANLMPYEGSSIAALKFGMFGFWVAAVAVLVVPLLFLAPRLFEAKQRGLNDYGILASEYTRDFDRKWLRPAQPARESLLGTPDTQFSFRLNQSYSVVHEMRVVMIDRHTLLGLAIPPIIPMLGCWFPRCEWKRFSRPFCDCLPDGGLTASTGKLIKFPAIHRTSVYANILPGTAEAAS